MAELTQDDLKKRAASRALEFVRPGMALGLGTGTTATFFVEQLGAKVRSGLDVLCVPTSETTRSQAATAGIPLTTLDETPSLDLTIDGADEFDAELRLIKGGGGALLREKIVASASRALVVIADASKEVATLGRFPLPVEVNRFGLASTRLLVERTAADLGLTGAIVLRQVKGTAEAFVTDGGHLIFDCHFGEIPAPHHLADRLVAIPGVVEHGLFLGLAKTIVIADPAGTRVIGVDPNQ